MGTVMESFGKIGKWALLGREEEFQILPCSWSTGNTIAVTYLHGGL